ncbi:glycosyltransferase (plasmid) [Pseudanabaena biceps]|nr:glycosyltransferase [Pseudanabaena biceps]
MAIAQPLVSICMPAYNAGNTIGEALGSVLSQTYQNIEVVVIDDGSSDRTSDIVQSFKDSRVRYFCNPQNLGGFQTMNKAIDLAKGDLVAVYHSDDIYEPNIVEKEVAYLQSNPKSGAVFCLDHFIDEEGHVYGGATMPREFRGKEFLNYEEVFPFLMRYKNILFCCPTFMARKSVLNTVGLFNAEKYDIAADLELWLRISRQFPVGILDERLMYYRHTKFQWSSRYKRLRTTPELFFAIMDDYLEMDRWSQRLTSKEFTEYAFHRCDDETFQAVNWIIQGEPHKAQQLLKHPYPWQTLFTDPHQRKLRRKLRVLLMRAVLSVGIYLGLRQPLTKLLVWTEYGGNV